MHVENEAGLKGDGRDCSRVAIDAFKSPDPADLLAHPREQKELHRMCTKRWPSFNQSSAQLHNTSWESVFGVGVTTEELFMVNVFAQFVDQVAAVDRAEYELSLYTNAWLNFEDPSVLDLSGIPSDNGTPTIAEGGSKPGVYLQGGPGSHVSDIGIFTPWRRATLISSARTSICLTMIGRVSNIDIGTTFSARDLAGASRTLADGSYGAIGCSPFDIDTVKMNLAEQAAWTRITAC